jgi:antitoxin (DNA-binding transcriptional repressor) of toxin-antitoxin stability system
MKTATVREVRQNFGQLLSWIDSGEEVTITFRRKPVARLTSIAQLQTKKGKFKMPDFAARQKAMFGDRVLEGNSAEIERRGYKW